MKVLVPLENKERESKISVAFGRAPFFAIVDTENDDIVFEKNQNTERAGGVGITTSQFAIDKKVDKVIVVNIGPKAENVLSSADIQIERVSKDKKLSELFNEKF